MHESDRNRLTKELTARLFAADEMLEAQAAAMKRERMMAEDRDTALRVTANPHLRWALETGMSVAHSRAFTSSTFHTLDRDEYRPDDP